MEKLKGILISMRQIIRHISPLLLLMLFLGISNLQSETGNISQLRQGMNQDEIEKVMGSADKVMNVERHIYHQWGRVIVRENKISDIRLTGSYQDQTPLWRGDKSDEQPEDTNKLLYLRIGTPYTLIEETAGAPDEIVRGKDWHYNKGRQVIETQNGVITAVIRNRETGLAKLDWVKLNFSPLSLLIMNITIAFIMFGVALEIKPESFKQIIKEPKSLILGIFSQFLALPAITFLLIYFIQPTPSVALGMILVAACPGGNVSNFMSSLAKGNMALSISLTAFATVVAVFMTPVNFAFWGNLYSETSNMVIPIRIDFFEILRTVMLLLGLPVIVGIWFSRQYPKLTFKIIKPIKKISMVIFLMFVVGALLGNLEFFKSYIHLIMFIVIAHNGLALLTGFSIASLARLPKMDRRSLTIETGIQNSGLGLVLIFNPRLFDGLGGMAFIAAWWGIWHIISGLIMSYLWSRKPLPSEETNSVHVPSDS